MTVSPCLSVSGETVPEETLNFCFFELKKTLIRAKIKVWHYTTGCLSLKELATINIMPLTLPVASQSSYTVDNKCWSGCRHQGCLMESQYCMLTYRIWKKENSKQKTKNIQTLTKSWFCFSCQAFLSFLLDYMYRCFLYTTPVQSVTTANVSKFYNLSSALSQTLFVLVSGSENQMHASLYDTLKR